MSGAYFTAGSGHPYGHGVLHDDPRTEVRHCSWDTDWTPTPLIRGHADSLRRALIRIRAAVEDKDVDTAMRRIGEAAAALRWLDDDLATYTLEAPCGWDGDVEVTYTGRHATSWECPQCGGVHDAEADT
jgi:hypothetical protein